MEQADISTKYHRFVDDFNSGLDRDQLCTKYRLPHGRYDAFREFLVNKGYVFIDPSVPMEEPLKCPAIAVPQFQQYRAKAQGSQKRSNDANR